MSRTSLLIYGYVLFCLNNSTRPVRCLDVKSHTYTYFSQVVLLEFGSSSVIVCLEIKRQWWRIWQSGFRLRLYLSTNCSALLYHDFCAKRYFGFIRILCIGLEEVKQLGNQGKSDFFWEWVDFFFYNLLYLLLGVHLIIILPWTWSSHVRWKRIK